MDIYPSSRTLNPTMDPAAVFHPKKLAISQSVSATTPSLMDNPVGLHKRVIHEGKYWVWRNNFSFGT